MGWGGKPSIIPTYSMWYKRFVNRIELGREPAPFEGWEASLEQVRKAAHD